MYQEETFDDPMPALPLDGDMSAQVSHNKIHPAVLAAITMGCITAFFALITWSMNICLLLRRIRKRDEEANAHDPPSGPNTFEPKAHEHVVTGPLVDGPSEEEPVSAPTQVTRHSEPILDVKKITARNFYDSRGCPAALVCPLVILPGPLPIILSCIGIMCRWSRGSKPNQERNDCSIQPDASGATQVQALSGAYQGEVETLKEPIPLAGVVARSERRGNGEDG
ncbi:fad dependent oxidoreductase [Colletotrichum incanum]|uniref:Fad dependent oxidoreductase n=1 Tax=Colletotrichum incanum TaxID=1573173 RepID=A0A167B118_COLIC|nr:fad dependent oxidoreductase [Colletotrichum incanum]